MPGPKPDYKKDQKVKDMREKQHLTFKQIAILMGQDKKDVYVRYRRAGGKLVGRLSTP